MMKIDVIGDIHGCYDELQQLLIKLGYTSTNDGWSHPDKRQLVFLGDLTDRGPDSLSVIRLVYQLVVKDRVAKYTPGNHCNKLFRYFLGRPVKIQHGLETTVKECLALPHQDRQEIKQQFITLYEAADLYLELPQVNAIIAHAGIKQSLIGKQTKETETFVLYGDITGEIDEHSRPVRKDWAQHYKGSMWIIYGHTPVLTPRIVNRTINIDTGCVFGNALTAFRLPEEKTVSVPSKQPFEADRFRHFNK